MIISNPLKFVFSLIVFKLYLVVMYGIFIDQIIFTKVGDLIADLLIRLLLWLGEYIILPLSLFAGVLRTIVWLFSGSEDTYEYEFNAPTLLVNSGQNSPPGAENGAENSGVGEYIQVWEHTETGGILRKVIKNSPEHLRIIKNNEN